jgi:exopolyphosphatase/guanosine-5'-triphosphate,3'-diphosphate pyrophosphatase
MTISFEPTRSFVYNAARYDLLPKIAEMNYSQRAQLPGISVGRADQLLAGAIVAQETMEFLKLSTLEICPWALREGIILRRLDWFPDDAE